MDMFLSLSVLGNLIILPDSENRRISINNEI